MRKEVQETGEWGEIDCFFCGTGDGRKLRVKAGPPKGVRLSIEGNLDQPRNILSISSLLQGQSGVHPWHQSRHVAAGSSGAMSDVDSTEVVYKIRQ